MNKLSVSCFKSLVQTRPKGNWDFLTKLVMIWPGARVYYWNKQGFRTLLDTWPFQGRDKFGYPVCSLYHARGRIPHGFQMDQGFFKTIITIREQGESILALVCKSRSKEDMSQWNQLDLQVWVYPDLGPSIQVHLYSWTLDQLYHENPWAKQKIIRALNLARDLGRTDVESLNILAALTQQSLNEDPKIPEMSQKHE